MKALFGPICKLDFCKKIKKVSADKWQVLGGRHELNLATLLLTISMTNFRKTEFSTIEYFVSRLPLKSWYSDDLSAKQWRQKLTKMRAKVTM